MAYNKAHKNKEWKDFVKRYRFFNVNVLTVTFLIQAFTAKKFCVIKNIVYVNALYFITQYAENLVESEMVILRNLIVIVSPFLILFYLVEMHPKGGHV